jgi:hypothetical protein
MKTKSKLLVLLALSLASFAFLSFASAHTTVDSTTLFYYANGQSFTKPGTYNTVTLANNVWYFDGVSFTSQALTGKNQTISSIWVAFNFIALIPVLIGLSILIMALRTGDMDAGVIGVVIGTFVVSTVGIIVVNSVIGAMG